MSQKRSLRTQRASDEIPTSSMADIAFLLVVYFMVTLTFAATRGLDFGMSDEEPDTVVSRVESVLVEIDRSGSLVVDQKAMAVDGLLPYLQPILAQNPRKPVILRSSPDAPYRHMVSVYDVLRQGREILDLEQDIQVSLPTEREIRTFWH